MGVEHHTSWDYFVQTNNVILLKWLKQLLSATRSSAAIEFSNANSILRNFEIVGNTKASRQVFCYRMNRGHKCGRLLGHTNTWWYMISTYYLSHNMYLLYRYWVFDVFDSIIHLMTVFTMFLTVVMSKIVFDMALIQPWFNRTQWRLNTCAHMAINYTYGVRGWVPG